jgi:hypothetical protein
LRAGEVMHGRIYIAVAVPHATSMRALTRLKLRS